MRKEMVLARAANGPVSYHTLMEEFGWTQYLAKNTLARLSVRGRLTKRVAGRTPTTLIWYTLPPD